jgi:prophage antirepressor-like protein
MTNKFYLDVFDKILNINDNKVFIVFDKKGDIWFKYNDLLNSLGYKDIKRTRIDLNIDKKYFTNIKNLKGGITPPFEKMKVLQK